MKKSFLIAMAVLFSGILFLQSASMAHPPRPYPPPPPPPIGPPPPPLPPPIGPPIPPPRLLVPDIVILAPPVVFSGRVTITKGSLNVRSGPGPQHPVVGVVHRGNILEIHGKAPGWLYVMFLPGHFGWVSEIYTVEVP